MPFPWLSAPQPPFASFLLLLFSFSLPPLSPVFIVAFSLFSSELLSATSTRH